MNLARFSVNRPVTAGIVSFALFVMGIFSFLKMPVSLYPNVSMPFIAVTIPYPGASPEQVESKLLKPLEAELAGLKKIKRLLAFARPHVGQVILGFEMTADEREAVDAVREKVSAVKAKFPADTKEPVVQRIDVGAVPVMVFGIASENEPEAVKRSLDETLVRTLQQTSGVSEARIEGLGEEHLELQLNVAKMSALRVAAIDIYEQLALRTRVIPWGEITQKGNSIAVARSVPPADTTFWEKQMVTLKDGRSLRLSEVGELKKVRGENALGIFINGHRGLSLVVTKRSDANTVNTVKEIQKSLKKAALPPGVSLFKIIDQSEYIAENSKEVWYALFLGGIFAVIVILFFLTDIKSALISASALPVSVAGSFIFMNALGFSVNMMSLLALSLAIGLLIDDAVVVRESIYTEMEKGIPGKEAAVIGTDKVAAPVLATTLAVIAVFLPVAMMEGLVGQFFKEFGLTICISVALSIWVAFTLDPMLSAYFAGHPQPLKGKFWDDWRAFLNRTEIKVTEWGMLAFHKPKRMLFLSVLLFVGSAAFTALRGMDFMAYEDRGQMVVNLQTPPGSTRFTNEAVAAEAVKRLRELEGVQNVVAQIGIPEDRNETVIRAVFLPKAERKKGMLTLKQEAVARLQGLPAAWLVMDPPFIEGVAQDAPVAVYLYGENLDALRGEANRLSTEISKVPGVSGVRIQTAGKGESLDVQLKQEEIGFLGTSSQAAELTGRLALTGLDIGDVGSENLPFSLRLRSADREFSGQPGADTDHLLGQLLVPTLRGPVSLSQLADIRSGERETSIDRERRQRKITIWGTLDRTVSYDKVLGRVEALLKSVHPPFSAETAGDKEFFEEVQGSFAIAVIGSLFFIFIILASQFESLFRPFVILLTLPLAIIGGFLALSAFGLKLALGSIIGLILLIGLAAKNGILLVDAVGSKEKEYSLAEAVRLSVRERSRPILMTSIAMIFGMLPTALMNGGGSEFRAPMAIAIIGGVVSSTLLSFLVVPAVFGMIQKRRERHNRSRASIAGTAALLAMCTTMVSAGFFKQGLAAGAVAATNLNQNGTSLTAPDALGEPGTLHLKWEFAQTPVVRTLVGEIPSHSAAAASIAAAETGAAGARNSAILAFVGGAKVSLDEKWARPGIKESIVLPLPAQIGGPVSTAFTVLPRRKMELNVGWQFPVFNMQAIYGLKLSARLQEQIPLVRAAKREAASVDSLRNLLEVELALQRKRQFIFEEKIALARLDSIKERMRAGSASQLDEVQAQLSYQAAKASQVQARTDLTALRAQFNARTGKELPAEGTGLPALPFAENAPFQPSAVGALQGVVAVQNAVADLADSSFYPTAFLGLGYQKQWFPGAPLPQKIVQLGVEWNVLDAGVRVRTEAQSRSEALDLLSQARSLELELRAKYDTLNSRRADLRESLEAAVAAQNSAKNAQVQMSETLRAGLSKPNELRQADEARLKADFAVLQTQAGLQALALESLVLSGRWLAWLDEK